MLNYNIKKLIAAIAVLIVAGLGVGTIAIINNQDGSTEIKAETTIVPEAEIKYADEQVPAVITEETGQGAAETETTEIDGQEIPTVESVESTGPVTEINGEEIYQKCLQENEECGQGAVYPQLDISSLQAFTDAVLGKCIDVDGYYGAQCWDLVSAMHHQYTGKVLTTCGTGAAKGVIADGCWQQNYTPDKYRMIWDPSEIVAGAHVYFGSGPFGHEGIAKGPVHNSYITLLGQNQGGGYCPGGGSASNIINISVKDFIGAAMPLIWDTPEPTPEPEASADNCALRVVMPGDTLGKIMQECRGEVEWGEPMNDYARHWYSTTFRVYLNVFDGWNSTNGVGLFAGDTIEYRTE